MIDCKSPNRTLDVARNCKCQRCRQWWADNVKGYFLCSVCLEVSFCDKYEAENLTVCEECLDEGINNVTSI